MKAKKRRAASSEESEDEGTKAATTVPAVDSDAQDENEVPEKTKLEKLRAKSKSKLSRRRREKLKRRAQREIWKRLHGRQAKQEEDDEEKEDEEVYEDGSEDEAPNLEFPPLSGVTVQPSKPAKIKKKSKKQKKDAPANADPEALIPLQYSFSETLNAERFLFLKKDLSNPLSLLVANVSRHLPIETVRAFFESYVHVPVEDARIVRTTDPNGDLNKGSRTASVIFKTAKGVEEALAKVPSLEPLRAADFTAEEELFKSTFLGGSATSIDKYDSDLIKERRKSLRPAEEIKAEANAFLAKHDEKIVQAKREAKRRQTEPDDEGWITVTSSASRRAVPEPVVVSKKDALPPSKSAKKRKANDDDAFYAFKVKESKMKQMEELRVKYEEDKQRVAKAKATRKFRPD